MHFNLRPALNHIQLVYYASKKTIKYFYDVACMPSRQARKSLAPYVHISHKQVKEVVKKTFL